MTRHNRAYRALLRLYPATFRDDYGEEMARLFGEQLLDARAANGRQAVAGLWARAIADVLETAPRHHIRKERQVPEPIPAGASAVAPPARSASRSGPRLLLGLLPFWVLLFFTLLAPGFTDPLFASPPAIFGLPAGLFVIAAALGLMLAGTWLIQRAESDVGMLLAFVLFTIPALMVIFFGPAVILIVVNLASS